MSEISRRLGENVGMLRAKKAEGYEEVPINIAIGAFEVAIMLNERCEDLEKRLESVKTTAITGFTKLAAEHRVTVERVRRYYEYLR